MTTALPSQPMSPRLKFFFSRIFPLIFVVIGATIAFFGIRGLILAKASVEWPTAQGSVVESWVDRQFSRDKNRSTYHYYARLFYEFSVDGTTFTGDRVAYGDHGSNDPSHARGVVSRYPQGKTVTVYYMPGNPEECVLEPGLQGQAWFLPGLGLVFFVVGIGLAIIAPGIIRKQEITEPSL
jgi:hypothetical protein